MPFSTIRSGIGPSGPIFIFLTLCSVTLLPGPRPAAAQVIDRIGDAAARTAEAETKRQVRRGVRAAIRCAVQDRVCQDRAREEGREVILVDEQGDPIDGGALGDATWEIELGDDEWEGDAGHVIEDEVLFTLHLTADDDVTLYLFLPEDEEGQHRAEAVLLASDDGDRCQYPYQGSAPFVVRLDRVDDREVSGAYHGTVQCEDTGPVVRAIGTFRITR